MTAQSSAGRATFLPTTRVGKWAGWLLVSSIVLLAVLIVAYSTDAFGGIFDPGTAARLALGVLTAIPAVGALLTGGMSRLKFKDHSVVVIGAMIVGVLIVTLLVFGAMPQD